jgi:UDP-glucose 4-epimerase
MKEDRPLPLPSPYRIIAYQKIVEVATSEFAKRSGISSVCFRLFGMFGPGQDRDKEPSPHDWSTLLSAENPRHSRAYSGGLQTMDSIYATSRTRRAPSLCFRQRSSPRRHNVGAGRATPNRELVEAIEGMVPGFKADLPPGHWPGPPLPVLDTERLRADTGFSPAFDIRSAIRDYVDWLRAGNPK